MLVDFTLFQERDRSLPWSERERETHNTHTYTHTHICKIHTHTKHTYIHIIKCIKQNILLSINIVGCHQTPANTVWKIQKIPCNLIMKTYGKIDYKNSIENMAINFEYSKKVKNVVYSDIYIYIYIYLRKPFTTK